MKNLVFTFLGLISVINLFGQCDLKITTNTKSKLEICKGANYLVQPKVNVPSNIVWYKNNDVFEFADNYSAYINAPGVYKVFATSIADPNCKAWSEEITVTTIDFPTVELSVPKTSFCPNETVLISSNLTDQSGWNIQWYKYDVQIDGANDENYDANSTGNYRIEISKNECVRFSNFVYVKKLNAPDANFDLSLVGAKGVNLTNTTTGANSYSWNFGDGVNSKLSNPSHIYNVNGTYDITLIAASDNGCSDTIVKKLFIGSSANNDLAENYLEVYPNPTSSIVRMDNNFDISKAKISVIDVAGKNIEIPIDYNLNLIDFSSVDSGIYFVKVLFNNNQLIKKVIKI